MSEASASRRSTRRAIVTGAICFGLGSIVMVRADVLPPSQQFAIRDPMDETFFARVNDQGELSVADDEARLSLRDIVDRLTELNVSVPGGVEVNNFPATQTVSGSVSINNVPFVRVVNSPGTPLEVTVPGAVATYAADERGFPFDVDLPFGVGDTCQSFTVPPNKSLKIYGITAGGYSSTPPLIRLELTRLSQARVHYISTTWTPVMWGGTSTWGAFSGTHTVRFYADAGTHRVCASTIRGQGASGYVSIQGALSG